MNLSSSRLRLTEIFYSLQGESTTVGLPTVFVRLTGCPLRCTYCDTAYAFHGGNWHSFDAIVEKIATYCCSQICVTGGEPLAQPGCAALLTLLCDKGYRVSLETSGAIDLASVDARVMIVMDLKAPDSGEVERNLWSNIAHLKPQDQIKIVISSEADYQWARTQLEERALHRHAEVLFSPAWQTMSPATLADWIIRDHLPVRFQVQLHKVLWGDAPGR